MAKRTHLNRPKYKVGYKKPPKHTQFKPGKSGNPKGRPKRTKNLKTDLQEEMNEMVSITEGGNVRVVSKQRAIVKRMTAKALSGDARSTEQIMKLIIMHLTDEDGNQDIEQLLTEDVAILDRFFKQYVQRQTVNHHDSNKPRKR